MVKDADEEQEVATEDEQKEGDEPLDGEEETTNDLHEFTNKNQYSTTQVLGTERRCRQTRPGRRRRQKGILSRDKQGK